MLLPVTIQLSKIRESYQLHANSFQHSASRFFKAGGRLLKAVFCFLVGLGRFELPTSPLSGVRSNHLSYRPSGANYGPPNWWSWSGSNRRPPECKSGALPAELQPLFARRLSPPRDLVSRPIGRAGQHQAIRYSRESNTQVENPRRIWTGKTATYLFRWLQPLSLLERR